MEAHPNMRNGMIRTQPTMSDSDGVELTLEATVDIHFAAEVRTSAHESTKYTRSTTETFSGKAL